MSEAMIIPAPVDEEVLHRLGANFTAEIRDGAGDLTGYEVRPEVDMSAYGAMLETVQRERLLGHAAAARFAAETGGIEFEGQPIATDRESQGLISGAFALVQQQPERMIRFKTPAGFVTLDAEQMSAIAIAVAQHVQACFATEAEAAEAIEAGTITTIAEIDAAFAI